MNNRLFKYLAGVSLLAACMLCVSIIALSYPVETPRYPEVTSTIDYIGDGDTAPITTQDALTRIKLNGNEASDLTVLASIAQKTRVAVERDERGLKFVNRFSEGGMFSFGLDISEDSVVETIYDVQAQTLNFVIPAYRPMVGQETWIIPTTTVAYIKNVPLNARLQLLGERSFIFGTDYRALSITLAELRKGNIVLLKQANKNILSQRTSSFEDGAWSKSVSDCNKNGLGVADISMSISSDATNGYRSLLLSSNNHSACTNRSFNVNFRPGYIYELAFDYKGIEGESAQYYYRTGKGDSAYQESQALKAKTDVWQTFATPVVNKRSGIQLIDIYFYAASNGSKKVSNLYDNVRLSESYQEPRQIVYIDSIKLESVHGVVLPLGENSISLDEADTVNILDKETASFENGLWTHSVADCNIRAAGVAEIAMSLSSDATEGIAALKLDSKNHPACTNKLFSAELRPDQIYSLSLDYNNIQGQSGRLYYRLQGKGIKSEYSKSLVPSINKWSSYTAEIMPDGISNGIDIYLYAPSSGDQVTTLYDNLSLVRTMPKNFLWAYIFRDKTVEKGDTASLEFRPVSSWKMLIRLHRAQKPMLLVVPTEFDRKTNANILDAAENEGADDGGATSVRNDELRNWYLFGKGRYVIPSSLHYRVNDYSNGWFIDPEDICINKGVKCIKNSDGTYEIDLVIESRLQWWFCLSLLISSIVLAGCLGYLGYYGTRWLCRRHATRKERKQNMSKTV